MNWKHRISVSDFSCFFLFVSTFSFVPLFRRLLYFIITSLSPTFLFQRHLSFIDISFSSSPLFHRYLSVTVTDRERTVSQSKILSWKIMCSRTVDLFISILLRATKFRCLFLSWLVWCFSEPRSCSKISSKHASSIDSKQIYCMV